MLLKPFPQTIICQILVDLTASITNTKEADGRIFKRKSSDALAAWLLGTVLYLFFLTVSTIAKNVPASQVLHSLEILLSIVSWISFVWMYWYLLLRIISLRSSLNPKQASLLSTVLVGVLISLADSLLTHKGVPATSALNIGHFESKVIEIVGYLLATGLPTYSVWKSSRVIA